MSLQSDPLHAPRPVEGEAYSTGPCSSPTCISWLASNMSPRCSGWCYKPEGPLHAYPQLLVTFHLPTRYLPFLCLGGAGFGRWVFGCP